MDILYRSLVQRLRNEVPDIRWIDLDGGQLEAPDESYPVQFPAAMIDISDVAYQTLHRGNQTALVNITVRLAFDIYEGFHGTAPDLEQAADRLKLINQVQKALHGFNGLILPANRLATSYQDNYFNSLVRHSMAAERRDDGLKIYAMRYQTLMTDPHASRVYTQVQAELDVTELTPE